MSERAWPKLGAIIVALIAMLDGDPEASVDWATADGIAAWSGATALAREPWRVWELDEWLRLDTRLGLYDLLERALRMRETLLVTLRAAREVP